jgi:aspartate racemase
MDFSSDKVIGIVGGMGPEAGGSVFNRILLQTQAKCDQDHVSVILMSFPKHIADRTAFLEGLTDRNPAYAVAEVIRKLASAGAKIVAIGCNTCHAPAILQVIEDILKRENCAVKLLNLPYEVLEFLRTEHPKVVRVGLMTTNGTFKARVYENLLQEHGYDLVRPNPEFQDNVIHRLIYDSRIGLKANPGIVTDKAQSLLSQSIHFFETRNVEALILGCTELSALESQLKSTKMAILNSTDILAKALLREAL